MHNESCRTKVAGDLTPREKVNKLNHHALFPQPIYSQFHIKVAKFLHALGILTTMALMRCPYCVSEDDFREMLQQDEGIFACPNCGHGLKPPDPNLSAPARNVPKRECSISDECSDPSEKISLRSHDILGPQTAVCGSSLPACNTFLHRKRNVHPRF
jgi:hypothetical protein